MTLSENPGALKRFGRTQWRFQQTFHTPLKNLRPFVSTIVSANKSIQAGCATIDEVVFEPKNLIALLRKHLLPIQYAREVTLTAAGPREVEELLEAILGDWVDFLFISTPKPFIIYADHDEYTTFYANTKSNLNLVVEPLSAKGFEIVRDYERPLSLHSGR
jgi:hypothetical protein